MQLDERQAFEAMAKFLEGFYLRTGGDMATLMADIEIQRDGMPNDPAAWSDWISAVNHVLTHGDRQTGPET